MKVLIIEDNLILSRNLTKMLILDDIFTEIALDWIDGLNKAKSKYFDVIILDINLPWLNWIEVCKALREAWKEVWILMLTSNDSKSDIVKWLNIWADDYLTKPFDYEELLARILVIARRKVKNQSTTILKVNSLEINLQTLEVFFENNEVKLSKYEFELLKLLSQNAWKIVSRQEIYEKIWWESTSDFIFSRTIDVHIKNLRKKLSTNLIQTKKWYWFIIE